MVAKISGYKYCNLICVLLAFTARKFFSFLHKSEEPLKNLKTCRAIYLGLDLKSFGKRFEICLLIQSLSAFYITKFDSLNTNTVEQFYPQLTARIMQIQYMCTVLREQ